MNIFLKLYYKTHEFFERQCSKEVRKFHQQQRGEQVKRLPRWMFKLFSDIEYNIRPNKFLPQKRTWIQVIFFWPIALYFDLKQYQYEQINRGDPIWMKMNRDNIYFTR